MTKRSLHTLIDYLRRGVLRLGDAGQTDAQLLERWTNDRDSAAFELLLWRHGPMVLSTCRRLLPRNEDAEDAFQAVFLVLLRKAASIRRREALAAWLHRVAYRISLRMRTAASQRASREQPLADAPAAPHVEEAALSDLRAILDEEINRLPVHYRRALILCCLEGKTQEEAARLLSCPRGTVSSWLTRGRERLRQRLLRRGIVVSTAGLAALAPDALAMGGVLPLIGSLIRVAGGVAPAGLLSCRTIALAEGMLRMMLMTKVKTIAAVLFVAVAFASGVGTISHSMRTADPPTTPQAPKETPKDAQNRERLNLDDLRFRGEHDGIAWGKAAHGLQAGIAFRPGDQETFEVGQSVTFVVYLRNVSDKEIRLSHIEPMFEESVMPTVEDADGNRLAVAFGPIKLGQVPIVRRSVKPGQRITFGYPWFRIRPLDWRGEVIGPTCCAAPGRYKVGFTGLSLRLNEDKSDVNGPATGRVELDIGKAKEAKETPAAKKTLTPNGMRALYQRADAHYWLIIESTNERREYVNLEVAEHFREVNRRSWASVAEEFAKLEELIEEPSRAALLSLKQREEIPFRTASCYYNLEEYEKALRKYENIAAKWGKKKQALRAMGETIKCLASTDSKRMKQRIQEIHGMLDTTEGLTEAERQQWLDWLRQINPAYGYNPFIPTLLREEERQTPGATKSANLETRNTTGLPRLFYLPSRDIGIPVHIDPNERERRTEILLLASDDEGATYKQIDAKTAHAKMFRFQAPRDGTYWLSVQTVDKEGRLHPADMSHVKPAMKVCVDTKRPVIDDLQVRREGDTIHLGWVVKDANLEEKPITLEWTEKANGPWHPIESLANNGHFEWRPTEPIPSSFNVRLRVRDKAGNESSFIQTLLEKSK